jgi:ABC-type Fe3+-hydroxamate transport system substrate-binding protein
MIRLLIFLAFFHGVEARAAFQRIVCLNPVISEWVAEILGPEASLKRVVGVSEYSNHPVFLKEISRIGPYPRLHIERIAALKPDLVLGSEEYNMLDQVEQLKRLKLNVVSLKKESFGSMEEWIGSLGKALGESEGASRAKARWKNLREALRNSRLAPKRVFIEVQHRPLIAVGGESFLSEALEVVGYRNVFSDVKSGYPKVSMESVLKADPEWILILDHAGDSSEVMDSKRDWTRFQTISAVRSGRIKLLPGDDFARCSLRLLNALKGLRSMHEERDP